MFPFLLIIYPIYCGTYGSSTYIKSKNNPYVDEVHVYSA